MLVTLSQVRSAIANDALSACFQPIVELRYGRITGFEVLARWEHPEGGLMLPPNLIDLAIQDGLIDTLTRQIFRKAFAAAASLPAHLTLSVNVSPMQLKDRRLPELIADTAHKCGFAPNRITVEITESAILDNIAMAGTVARDLKALGCRIALDDFGTGYSSLSHVQSLDLDELKVDLSFIRDMSSSRSSRKIVAAIIGLGRSLGAVTVAEGVETEEQAEKLLRLGCAQAQGWLFGRPVTADRLPDVLAAPPHALAPQDPSHGDQRIPLCLEAMPENQPALLRALYEGVPVGMCFLDRELRHISLNRRIAEINGAPIAAHLGRTIQEMNPAIATRVQPYLHRVLRGESLSDMEIVRPGPRIGEERTYLASYSPAFDEAGDVIGVLVAVLDITKRKRAETALRETEEHFHNFIELSPHGVWVADPHGNIVEMSPRWVAMSGLAPEQMRGSGWLLALHPDDLPSTKMATEESLRTGQPIDVEFRMKLAEGDYRWFRSRGTARIGGSGQILGWYGTFEDIDDRRRERERLLAEVRELQSRLRLAEVVTGFTVE